MSRWPYPSPLSLAAGHAAEVVDGQTVDAAAPVPAGPRLVQPHRHGVAGRPTLLISLGTAAVLVLLWWLASRSGLVSRLFLPSPPEVLATARMLLADGYANATLAEHVGASLGRIGLAALIATALGIPLGLLMGLNRWVKGILDTPIEFYWPLPPLAYLPLMIIWLGIGEASKVTLLTLAMFAPIALSAQAGVRALPIERVQAAQSLGATSWQLLRHIVLPSALPEILTGLRIALGVGWSTLVAAELIAAQRGIGHMVLSASHFLATDVVFVGIGVIALCAFAFSWGMRVLERLLVPWKGKS